MKPESEIRERLGRTAGHLLVDVPSPDPVIRRGRRRFAARVTGYGLTAVVLVTAIAIGGASVAGLFGLRGRTIELPGGGTIQEPRIERAIAISGAASGVAVGDGSVWVAEFEHHSILRIDPSTNRVTATIPLGETSPDDVTFGEGAVWVAGAFGVIRIDPATNDRSGLIAVEGHIQAIAAGAGSVWVTTSSQDLIRIDPTTNKVATTTRLPVIGFGIAVGLDAVWVGACPNAGGTLVPGNEGVLRIDPGTGRVVDAIPLPYPAELAKFGCVNSVTIGGGSVWVVGVAPHPQKGAYVWEIDPSTDAVVSTGGPLDRSDQFIVFFGGVDWVLGNHENGTSVVSIVDPGSGRRVGKPLSVGRFGTKMAAGFGSLWVPALDRAGSPVVYRIAP